MAQHMFQRHGMPVDVFFAQDLRLYLNMQRAQEAEPIYFIDEV